MAKTEELEYDIQFNIVNSYIMSVKASNEDEAEEKAKELAYSLSEENLREYSLEEVQVEITSIVCNDEDYESYLEECENYEVEPLSKKDDWEKHLEDLINNDWYESIYLDYIQNKGNLITDFKEKKKFINTVKKTDNPIVRIKTNAFEKEEELFLDITKNKVRKDFLFIPYRNKINGELVHLRGVTSKPIDDLLQEIDIYDEEVIKINENEANFLISKLKLN